MTLQQTIISSLQTPLQNMNSRKQERNIAVMIAVDLTDARPRFWVVDCDQLYLQKLNPFQF